MTDTEKKIAEIREGYKSERDDSFTYKKEIVEQDIRFLLSELERLEREYAEERAAHNAHVAELCELEEKNRKLREERDAAVEGYQQQVKYAGELMTKLVSAQQERNMYKSSSEVFYERLKKVDEEREKLIECLRFYERLARGREINDGGRRARTLLAEIGVTVE